MTNYYMAAQSPEQALEALEDGARVIAGGTDLMVALRRRRLKGQDEPVRLVDVTPIPRFSRLDLDAEEPFIGSAVTFHRLERHPGVNERLSLLSAAAATVGSVQIRNLATIGGNVANASPAADGMTALTALGARVEILSASGVRFATLEDLITGPNETSLSPGELIAGFRLTPPPEGFVQRFRKIGRRQAVVIARLNLAVCLDRKLEDPRVVLGACFPSPRRLTEVETLLRSGTPGPDLWREAGRAAARKFTDVCGIRPSAAYKVPAIERVVATELETAWREAGGTP